MTHTNDDEDASSRRVAFAGAGRIAAAWIGRDVCESWTFTVTAGGFGARGPPRDRHRPATASSTRDDAAASRGSLGEELGCGSGSAAGSIIRGGSRLLTCFGAFVVPPARSASFSARAALNASRRYPHSSSSRSTSDRNRAFSADVNRHREESCSSRLSTVGDSPGGDSPGGRAAAGPVRAGPPGPSSTTIVGTLSSVGSTAGGDSPPGGDSPGGDSPGGDASGGAGGRVSASEPASSAAGSSFGARSSSSSTRSSSTGTACTASSLTAGASSFSCSSSRSSSSSFLAGASISRRPSGMPTHLAEHTGHLVSVANQSSAQSPQRWWPHAVTRGGLFVESRSASTPSRQMLFILDTEREWREGSVTGGVVDGGRGGWTGRGAGGYETITRRSGTHLHAMTMLDTSQARVRRARRARRCGGFFGRPVGLV